MKLSEKVINEYKSLSESWLPKKYQKKIDTIGEIIGFSYKPTRNLGVTLGTVINEAIYRWFNDGDNLENVRDINFRKVLSDIADAIPGSLSELRSALRRVSEMDNTETLVKSSLLGPLLDLIIENKEVTLNDTINIYDKSKYSGDYEQDRW